MNITQEGEDYQFKIEKPLYEERLFEICKTYQCSIARAKQILIQEDLRKNFEEYLKNYC